MIKLPFKKSAYLGAAVAVSLLGSLQADEPELLTEPDRKAMLDKLAEIEQASNDRISGLYKRALSAYRGAVQSENGAMELYIQCIEKVQFTDQHKEASEFREWKKKNKDRLGEESMKLALKHQLMWLLLSIEAASKDGDLTEMGNKALTQMNQIFSNAEVLGEHHNIVEQDALGSVFAKAYDLNIKIKNWPKSGLDIDGIYEKLIFPKLKSLSTISEYRDAWNRKNLFHGYKVEKWSGFTRRRQDRDKPDDNAQETAMEKFVAEERPVLQWQMEKECFQLGDEQTAGLKMINYLERYYQHKQAPKWIEELKELVGPVQEEEIEVGGEL